MTCTDGIVDTCNVNDRGLCHGTAGLLATARRLAGDGLTPTPVGRIEALHRKAVPSTNESAGLLDGTAGSDLATLATITTAWDACLLLA
jgi:lantibiotic biosynthesis protein